jgi:hypothetical protein
MKFPKFKIQVHVLVYSLMFGNHDIHDDDNDDYTDNDDDNEWWRMMICWLFCLYRSIIMMIGGGTLAALAYTKVYGVSEEEKHQMLVSA